MEKFCQSDEENLITNSLDCGIGDYFFYTAGLLWEEMNLSHSPAHVTVDGYDFYRDYIADNLTYIIDKYSDYCYSRLLISEIDDPEIVPVLSRSLPLAMRYIVDRHFIQCSYHMIENALLYANGITFSDEDEKIKFLVTSPILHRMDHLVGDMNMRDEMIYFDENLYKLYLHKNVMEKRWIDERSREIFWWSIPHGYKGCRFPHRTYYLYSYWHGSEDDCTVKFADHVDKCEECGVEFLEITYEES